MTGYKSTGCPHSCPHRRWNSDRRDPSHSTRRSRSRSHSGPSKGTACRRSSLTAEASGRCTPCTCTCHSPHTCRRAALHLLLSGFSSPGLSSDLGCTRMILSARGPEEKEDPRSLCSEELLLVLPRAAARARADCADGPGQREPWLKGGPVGAGAGRAGGLRQPVESFVFVLGRGARSRLEPSSGAQWAPPCTHSCSGWP